jgi:hypothetical protein
VVVGIVVLDDASQANDLNGQSGLLQAFPDGCLRWRLAGLAFASGKLPIAGVDSAGGTTANE